jgi:hypothetical protein
MFLNKYKLISGAAAYSLDIGFEPDTIEVWNATKWATDGTKVKFYWHKGMTAGYALSEAADDTSINRAIETSNGFTVASSTSIASNRGTISGISTASPCVITIGDTTGWVTGDRVRIRDVTGTTSALGSLLNDNLYSVTIINGTTFSLQTLDGSAVSTVGLTYSSGGYAYNISKEVSNEGSYRVTLGSTIMGADNDQIFIECRQADKSVDLGDVA